MVSLSPEIEMYGILIAAKVWTHCPEPNAKRITSFFVITFNGRGS